MDASNIFNREGLKRHNKFVAKNKSMVSIVEEKKGSAWVTLSKEEYEKLEKEKNK